MNVGAPGPDGGGIGKPQDNCGGGGATWREPKPGGGVGGGANVGRLQHGCGGGPKPGGGGVGRIGSEVGRRSGGEAKPGGGSVWRISSDVGRRPVGEPKPGGGERIGSNSGWPLHGDEGGGTTVCGRGVGDGGGGGGVGERIHRGGVDGAADDISSHSSSMTTSSFTLAVLEAAGRW